MRHWKITVKEHGTPRAIETEHIGNLDYRGVIEFFGLQEPDVEWYKIEEVQE